MRNTVDIVGVNIDNITLEDSYGILNDFVQSDRFNMIFTPNSEILYVAVKDREMENILNSAQLVIPDGIGVVIASKFYGTPLKERVTGIDLVGKLMQLARDKQKNVYILGAAPGVAEEAAIKMIEKYGSINFVGIRDGYFTEEDEEKLIEDINSKNTDILLVGLGSPKQEKLIYKYRNELKAKIAIGIGGSIDVYAGKAERAPEFMQKAGLEWLHRLIKEPKRIGRMMRLPKFALLAFYDAKTRGKE